MRFLNHFRRSTTRLEDEVQPEAEVETKTVLDGELASDISPGNQEVLGIGALNVMAERIYRACRTRGWLQVQQHPQRDVITGVAIRSKHGRIRSWPQHIGLQPFENGIIKLNCRVAVKLSCKALDVIMDLHV